MQEHQTSDCEHEQNETNVLDQFEGSCSEDFQQEIINCRNGINQEEALSITTPSKIIRDDQKESVAEIRKFIEDLVSKPWDRLEGSRPISVSDKMSLTLGRKVSLLEIKRALYPYIHSGWFITVSLPHSSKEDVFLTYEANTLFVSSSKFGNNDQSEDIYIRFYPDQPVNVMYATSVKRLGTITIPLIAIGIITSLAASIAFHFAFLGLTVLASILMSLLCLAAPIPVVLKRSRSKSKKYGPLLWVDYVKRFESETQVVTKKQRIQEVVKNNILETDAELALENLRYLG